MRTGHVIAALALHAAACGDSAPRCPTRTRSENGVCVSAEDAELAGGRDGEVTSPPRGQDGDGGSSDTATNDGGVGAETDGAETASPTDCYVDEDGDGFGTSEVTDCSLAATADRDGDCNDSSADQYPGAQELCDLADNDCDGKVDNGAGNACGGPCTAKLAHAPGEECSNGLLGSCSRTGVYVCSGATSVTCDAPQPSPSSEVCGDGVDNDCNGRVDEPTAADAATWYQDCDGDGYAAFTQGSVRGCTKPANAEGCTWTSVIPNAETRTNWDCDDSNPSYTPKATAGSPNGGNTSWDLDCNGTATVDSRTQNLVSPLAINLSGGTGPKVCNSMAINTLNDGLCNNIPLSANVPCITWRRTTGLYSTYPDVFCPDAPVLFRGDGSGPGGCELISLPFAYLCK